MTDFEACCTCATLLSSIPPQYDEKTEKPAQHERRLPCCGRAICARCTTDNPRLATYCPFCQISTAPSSLPQGLRDPPAYSPPPSPRLHDARIAYDEAEHPPAYTERSNTDFSSEKESRDEPAPDVLHFVDAAQDTVASLSLRYGVPAQALRRVNGLYADHLVAARRTVLIPGEFYKGGVSLSPRPIEGEEEEIRKGKVRKWMVACKVAEYDVALLYLEQSGYDLEAAIEAYKADERWEAENPLEGSPAPNARGKQSARRTKLAIGGGLVGQLS